MYSVWLFFHSLRFTDLFFTKILWTFIKQVVSCLPWAEHTIYQTTSDYDFKIVSEHFHRREVVALLSQYEVSMEWPTRKKKVVNATKNCLLVHVQCTCTCTCVHWDWVQSDLHITHVCMYCTCHVIIFGVNDPSKCLPPWNQSQFFIVRPFYDFLESVLMKILNYMYMYLNPYICFRMEKNHSTMKTASQELSVSFIEILDKFTGNWGLIPQQKFKISSFFTLNSAACMNISTGSSQDLQCLCSTNEKP